MVKYNDHELLYLVSESNEIAFEILIKKYEPLIKNRIVKYRINTKNYNDFYQECLSVLIMCIQKYNSDKKMSFSNYVDMSINYHIRNMLKKEKDYYYDVVLVDMTDIDYLKEETNDYVVTFKEENTFVSSYLSNYEEEVYNYISDGLNVKEIATEIERGKESVYNTISRIKRKLIKSKIIKENEDELTPLERAAYQKSLLGFKPREISKLLGVETSVVYNALKRAKNKKINKL